MRPRDVHRIERASLDILANDPPTGRDRLWMPRVMNRAVQVVRRQTVWAERRAM